MSRPDAVFVSKAGFYLPMFSGAYVFSPRVSASQPGGVFLILWFYHPITLGIVICLLSQKNGISIQTCNCLPGSTKLLLLGFF